MARVSDASLEWALKHIKLQGDTDLFPPPFEFEVIQRKWGVVKAHLLGIEVQDHDWSPPRSVFIPKNDLAYRHACQLDPVDAVLFAAIVKEIGQLIEAHRRPTTDRIVFSYRFNPTSKGHYYGNVDNWKEFWDRSIELANQSNCVLVTDISDYYNQTYHHAVTNGLQRCGIGQDFVSSVDHLFDKLTAGKSRGIPIGPHGSHIIAESTMIPIDNHLVLFGKPFCRYVDDFHFFVADREEARILILELVKSLDKDQKLSLNESKTRILSRAEFLALAQEKSGAAPPIQEEADIVAVIGNHTTGPYSAVSLSDIPLPDRDKLSAAGIRTVLGKHLQDGNFTRLRWILRRLAQVGAPGGVDFIINHVKDLTPVLRDAAHYLRSAKEEYTGSWEDVGDSLLSALDHPLVKKNDYLQMVFLSLFSRMTDLDHVPKLIERFDSSPPLARREIVLAIIAANGMTWIQQFKNEYGNLDPWLKRTILFGSKLFSQDERRFWLDRIKPTAGFLEGLVIDDVR